MYIALTLTMPNSAEATIHRVDALEVDQDGVTRVRINSFVDLAAEAVLWQEIYEVPVEVLSAGAYPSNVYDWLVGSGGFYDGGTLIDEASADLSGAQLLKWVEVKNLRDAVEFGGCETPLGMVDTDETSQQRITSTLAFSNLVGANFGVGWTMADNSVAWHDRPAFLMLAKLVGQHVSNAHSRAQSLRETIYALTDQSALEAFDVQAEWDALALQTETEEVILTEAGIELVA